MQEVIASLVIKKDYELARQVSKVYAFDTRFPLSQDDHKCMYLLHAPIFDKQWEVQLLDGSRKLMTDDEAREILLKERDINDALKEKAINQIKNISKFSRMGKVALDQKEEVEDVIQEIQQKEPQALKKETSNEQPIKDTTKSE